VRIFSFKLRAFYISLFVLAVFLAQIGAETVAPTATIKIPMRDGQELTTDIYLPSPESKNLPCILLRGPGGRHSSTATLYASLAKEGYVVAIQDTRSAGDPEGKTLPFYSDGWGKQQDGYDTVQWLAAQPLTNGKIGTLGISHMGITQLLMAPTAPPALKCQYISVAAASLYHHALFPQGKLLKNQVEGWLGLYAKHPSVVQLICRQDTYNDFWESFNTVKAAQQVQVPALHVGGWYDTFIQGTIDAFVSRQEMGGHGAKGQQKLVIGPWTHRVWPLKSKLGPFEIPEAGREPPYDLSPLRWFDYYLKGISHQFDKIPTVTYYVMGPFDGSPSSGNIWRTADRWPVPHQERALYLTADHKLVKNLETNSSSSITYTHDYANPVPTLGGRNLFLESGPVDQSPIEQRKDVLIFTTEPLQEDLEVTGRIFCKLLFSSNVDDTDIAVRLTDVYPDGKSLLIADGMIRMNPIGRSTESEKQVDEALIDLWSTSLVFAKGHRIRLIVSGSNYPKFEKSGHPNSVHTHYLEVGKNTSSQLILPVVREGGRWVVNPPVPPANTK
jgi:uncharacterized protein